MSDRRRDDRVDRYVRSELTAAEARELAQESLDNPELFEELTYSGLAKHAVAAGIEAEVGARPWRSGLLLAASIAAGIAVLVSVFALRQPRIVGGARSQVHPTLELAQAGQPVLLADGLPNVRDERTETFRGAESVSRPPRASGTVLAIEGGMAAIDAGSLDGLTKGLGLEVYREVDSPRAVGHVRVETVFRERARGPVEGHIRPGDRVRIPPAVQLTARMEQAQAMASRGDPGAARAAAEQAVQWAASANVPAESQVAAWNTLAVLRVLQADRTGGEALLRRALAACPQADVACAEVRNNLGVIAELAGDRRKAREQYAGAIQALSGNPRETQEKVIKSNLARVAR